MLLSRMNIINTPFLIAQISLRTKSWLKRCLGSALDVEDYLEFIMHPFRMKMNVQLSSKYSKGTLPFLIDQISMDIIMIMRLCLARQC